MSSLTPASVLAWFKAEYPQIRKGVQGSPMTGYKGMEAYLKGLKRACEENGLTGDQTDRMVWEALTEMPEELSVYHNENTAALVMHRHMAEKTGKPVTMVLGGYGVGVDVTPKYKAGAIPERPQRRPGAPHNRQPRPAGPACRHSRGY